MKKSPYILFKEEELILRDHLAIDRTILANENSILAYIRTSLTILVSGVSLLKFFDTLYIHYLGWLLIIMGIFTSIWGTVRYKRVATEIEAIRKKRNTSITTYQEKIK